MNGSVDSSDIERSFRINITGCIVKSGDESRRRSGTDVPVNNGKKSLVGNSGRAA